MPFSAIKDKHFTVMADIPGKQTEKQASDAAQQEIGMYSPEVSLAMI